jgi:hypothetical protein
MHPDVKPYYAFSSKARLEKSINSLLGFVEGIAIDGRVTAGEVAMLNAWLEDHRDVAHRHPYAELVPVVKSAVTDGILDPEERADITWLCERLRSVEFFDMVTADLQRLHAVVGSIAADGKVCEDELRGLSDWLGEHEHLKTCWPYDEIESITTKVMSDQRIDETEHRQLMGFFSEFLAMLDERTIVAPLIAEGESPALGALCSVMPNIHFTGSTFCFTGTSAKYKRREFELLVDRLGGRAVPSVTTKLNFLVIGAEGNPCWTFACYGRKVEKAVALRKQGIKVVLVHENDFHDAVLDS